jgi:hypothetical protein
MGTFSDYKVLLVLTYSSIRGLPENKSVGYKRDDTQEGTKAGKATN